MTKSKRYIVEIAKRLQTSSGEGKDYVSNWPQIIDITARLKQLAKRLHKQYEIQCNGCNKPEPRTSDNEVWKQWYILAEQDVKKSERVEEKCLDEIKSICDAAGIHYFIQGDPRGGTLYVSKEPLNYQNYHNGIFIA